MRQGFYEKTIQEADDAYRHTRKVDAEWSWKFRILEAEALMRNQQLKQSLELLAENPPANFPVEITARKRMVQGQALCRSGHRADGETLLNQAEKLIPPNSPPLQAELAFTRGYCSFPAPAIARQYFEKAVDLAKSTDPFIAASALGNIGYLLRKDGRYDEAIEWFQKVLPLARTEKSQLLEEKTLGLLGSSYAELGDFKRGIENSEQAERIASKIGRLEDEESWLIDLGRSYAAVPGDYSDKAEPSYLRALSIAKKLNDSDASHQCLHDLAQLALDEHNVDKARSYWQQEVANTSPDSRSEGDAWLDEAQIAIAERQFSKATELLQKIDRDPTTGLTRRAFVESHLAQVYWMEHKTVEADRIFRQSIHTVEQELTKTKEQYWASILDNNGHRFDNYIRFLIDQGQSVRALDQAEYLRRLALETRLANPRTELNIAAIQNRLKGHSQVILDYHVTDDESFLWLITANHTRLFHLPSHLELHYLIDSHNKEIQDQRTIEDSPAGQQLYKALIQPAEKFIPKDAHVSIIPSKILWLLNFETLIVPGNNPHYWIEDVSVQNSSSLMRASNSSGIRWHNQKELLLMGAPEEINPAFPTLKHAADEIGRVKGHFSAVQEQVISGGGATPQAYELSSPQQYRLIHFVTHGIANEKVPMESAIVLSGSESSYKLYAREITATPIHADLVTISACYGAGKRWYVGEGMVGLGWAFMRAGARQVIAALWEVDDAVTPQLMDDLYTGLNNRKSPETALRDAKLKLLARGDVHSRPYYWGSLQLYVR